MILLIKASIINKKKKKNTLICLPQKKKKLFRIKVVIFNGLSQRSTKNPVHIWQLMNVTWKELKFSKLELLPQKWASEVEFIILKNLMDQILCWLWPYDSSLSVVHNQRQCRTRKYLTLLKMSMLSKLKKNWQYPKIVSNKRKLIWQTTKTLTFRIKRFSPRSLDQNSGMWALWAPKKKLWTKRSCPLKGLKIMFKTNTWKAVLVWDGFKRFSSVGLNPKVAPLYKRVSWKKKMFFF